MPIVLLQQMQFRKIGQERRAAGRQFQRAPQLCFRFTKTFEFLQAESQQVVNCCALPVLQLLFIGLYRPGVVLPVKLQQTP